MSQFEIIEFAPVFIHFNHDPEERCYICRGLLIEPCARCKCKNILDSGCTVSKKTINGKNINVHDDCDELLFKINKKKTHKNN